MMSKKLPKKKRFLKLKRRTRRTISAVLMITAIIVAAIPVPDLSAVDMLAGDAPPPQLEYPTATADAAVNTDTEKLSLKAPAGAPAYTSYTIRDLDGEYQLTWRYKFWVADSAQGALNGLGIISAYNTGSLPLNGQLEINLSAVTAYETFTQAEFTTFVATIDQAMIDEHYPPKTNGDKIYVVGNVPLNIQLELYLYEKLPRYAPSQFEAKLVIDNSSSAPIASIDTGELLAKRTEEVEVDSKTYLTKPEEKPIQSIDTGTGKEKETKNSASDNQTPEVTTPDKTPTTPDTVPEAPSTGADDVESVPVLPQESENIEADNALPTEDIIPEEPLPMNEPQLMADPPGGGTDTKIYAIQNKTTKEWVVPDNATKIIGGIGDDVFADSEASALTNIKLPAGLMAIGNKAFAGVTRLMEISIPNTVTRIGHRAFKGCSALSKVDNQAIITQVGIETFADCTSLRDVKIPDKVNKIGMGAFVNSKVTNLDMSPSKQDPYVIDQFAFWNCASLTKVDFAENTTQIGKAAFGMPEASVMVNDLKTIVLPLNATILGESLFSGRGKLQDVTLPKNFGVNAAANIDNTIFEKCYDLSRVLFQEESRKATFSPAAFASVRNEGFYVEGPASDPKQASYDDETSFASPRKSAHDAGVTYKFTATVNGVPKIFYEVAEPAGFYRVNDENQLESFSPIKDANGNYQDIENLIIPSKVGEFKVTGVKTGWLPEAYKPHIKALTISDDSLSTVDERAFAGCTNMKWAIVGNSVNEIKKEAFQGCTKLEKITFNTPKAGYASMKLGADAFETGSDQLVFQGDIVPEYAPFKWAMDPGNYMDIQTGKRVCYKSNQPSNLTTMLDRVSNEVTLIDYPHYGDLDKDNADYIVAQKAYYIQMYTDNNTLTAPSADVPGKTNEQAIADYSITGKYEFAYLDGKIPQERYMQLNPFEESLVDATLNINIPVGITSIDVKSFLKAPKNAANKAYITDPTKLKMYEDDAGVSANRAVSSDTPAVYGGLFSGLRKEFPVPVDPNDPNDPNYQKETLVQGNDRIQSVTLNSVKALPDYAFNSCEALQNVTLGKDLANIGKAPFVGCNQMTGIGGNAKYIGENGIIYANKTDGTKEIVQCLGSRGKLIGMGTVSLESDPLLAKVTTIADGAFQNCDSVVRVSLTDAKTLKMIPENCFNDCDNLVQVILPESVNDIRNNAFTKTQSAIVVTIPGIEVSIMDNAFTHDPGVTIRTYKDSAAYTYANLFKIGTELIDKRYKVSFVDHDGKKLTEDQFVVENSAAIPPKDPTRTGYTFTGWSRDYKKITEDSLIFAKYNANPGTGGGGTGGGGTGGGGTGGGGTNGGTNNNGTNTDNSKKYKVTVKEGAGAGEYTAGTVVTVTATARLDNKIFDRWITKSKGAGFTDAYAVAATFTMPPNDVTVEATFKERAAVSSNTPPAPTPPADNTGGGNNNAGGGNGTGNVSSDGTVISITKPGVSDKDKASATVDGSDDQFMVKITESEIARAAVEEALLADEETLDSIQYFPMDISLYDSTGKTKIEDPQDISVNITMPIPDELRQYGGNNKVASVVDGELERLDATFKTIGGVPCVSFTATHFSPYTVYVDTNQLDAGMMQDNTPATGDGIHPKWFLVIGLSCISVVLFLKKDKRGKIQIA